ncbi:MAG: type II toxin-antitoxin system PemK/MazF family toxin [Ignavibacteria bacterium]|nr:type II toxin-antitoxin system PemK/MazF family toxin [Ignavibacteria bacterium]
MNKGDIILILFPFTDFSGDKLRPALVLVESPLDVTVAFITTKFALIHHNEILLRQSSFPFLKKDSLLKLNKLATIDIKFSAGRIGFLNQETLKLVDRNLIELFQLQSTI